MERSEGNFVERGDRPYSPYNSNPLERAIVNQSVINGYDSVFPGMLTTRQEGPCFPLIDIETGHAHFVEHEEEQDAAKGLRGNRKRSRDSVGEEKDNGRHE